MSVPYIQDILATAELLAERLRTLPELEGIEVIVDRQKDLAVILQGAIAKASGAAVIINVLSGQATAEASKMLELDQSITVSLWGLPILRPGAIDTAAIWPHILRACHWWHPYGTLFPQYRMVVRSWELEPDDSFRIYSMTGTFRDRIEPSTNP
jgi:hypothetical protein